MKWNIISDSSCDLFNFTIEEDSIKYATVPFAFNIGETTIIDDENLDTKQMLNKIYSSPSKEHIATACPSPNDWINEMKEDGHYILLTISSQLSGSYNSAVVAKDTILNDQPNKKIEIIDSRSTGPEIVLLVQKICELIKNNKNANGEADYDFVVSEARKYLSESKVTFALSSFDNLIRAGRMKKTAGILAKVLGIWGVGIASDQGTIVVKKKVTGKFFAIKSIIEDMGQRIPNPRSVCISHCHNEEVANKLKNKILEKWPEANVEIIPTKGLCSYYAEMNGLIVGFWGN